MVKSKLLDNAKSQRTMKDRGRRERSTAFEERFTPVEYGKTFHGVNLRSIPKAGFEERCA
jgi:hypothetical protein